MCSKSPKPVVNNTPPPPPPPPVLKSPDAESAGDAGTNSRKSGKARRSLRVDLGGIGGLKIK